QVRLGKVVQVTAADFRTEAYVTSGFLYGFQADSLILNELQCDLRHTPDHNVGTSHLCDGVVAVLRQPFRIEGLSPLIIENVLEPVFLQESNGVFQLCSQV